MSTSAESRTRYSREAMDPSDPRITPTSKRLRWNEAFCAFVDEDGAIYETEQQLEARGARPRAPAFIESLRGYVQTGPTSYERLGPGPDFRDVWQAQFHGVRTTSDAREPEAIARAAAILLNEGARSEAIELLTATRHR